MRFLASIPASIVSIVMFAVIPVIGRMLATTGDVPSHDRLSVLEQRSGWRRIWDGKTFEGWHVIGDASFTIDDAAVLGQSTSGKANSFLVSKHAYGDFLLELELKNELPGNSGIQIRSRVVGDDPILAHVAGYQIEIDPSSRSWSGGLYEERGRGWLQDLSRNDAGRNAFRPNEWNRYRIECIGPWIRAWVNDVPTTDCFDPESLDGVLALQVHSGKTTKLRWRNFTLRDFGKHAWEPLEAQAFHANGAKLGNDFGLRLTRTPTSTQAALTGWRLLFRSQSPTTPKDTDPDNPGFLSLALDDPRLINTKDQREWRQLTFLAYGDRITIHRDHELLPTLAFSATPDGPFLRFEKPTDPPEPSPFASIESLEQVR